jgi:hypothetical protein
MYEYEKHEQPLLDEFERRNDVYLPDLELTQILEIIKRLKDDQHFHQKVAF